MLDLPGVPTGGDEELRQLLREFLESKEDELSQYIESGDLDAGLVPVLTGSSNGKPMYKAAEEIDLYEIPIVVGEFPGEEGSQVLEYIKEKYNEGLPTDCLKRLYVDAFGQNADEIHDWRHNIPDIEQRLIADAQGRSKQRTVSILNGIECEANSIEVSENIQLVQPQEDEVYAMGQGSISRVHRQSIYHNSSILKIETRQRSQDRHVNMRSASQGRLALATLRLYTSNPVEIAVTHRIPVTYAPGSVMSDFNRSPTLMSGYTIEPDEEVKLANLYELLLNFFDMENRRFSTPINVALDHFETSVSTETDYHSSITFGIIGLESFYKHYITGNKSSSDVQRYAAFILDKIVPQFDVMDIKRDLETAYGTRNDLVHGDNPPNESDEKLQQHIWDYLRYSIVIFATLSHADDDSLPLPVEEALLDEAVREDLVTQLECVELFNYLPPTGE